MTPVTPPRRGAARPGGSAVRSGTGVRGRSWTAVGAALLVLLGAAAPAAAAPDGGEPATWLVQLDGTAELPAGTRVLERLDGVDAAVVEATPQQAARLAAAPGVLGVARDSSVQLAAAAYDPAGDAGSLQGVVAAAQAAGTGLTGAGVDVAVVDSGVTPVPGLDAPGRLVHGPDLSFESQRASTRSLDTFGHGTHMAGIVSAIAPGARLVSLKVADARGAADVSQVVAAIDWVVENRRAGGLDVRVLNLSFGTPALQAAQRDPLSHAVQVAWRKGIVVVVSAGNSGTTGGRLLNPAQDPYVLAVGASDGRGTTSPLDDVVADVSSRGDASRAPDLVAPGRSVASLRVPGSWVDLTYGATAAVGDRFIRGSGTSQAAAVVSGAAALLLQQRPGLNPDQVKALLRGSADRIAGADTRAQGAGRLDVAGALAARTPLTAQLHLLRTGGGSLDLARGGLRLVLDGLTLTGERDAFGRTYAATTRGVEQTGLLAWRSGSWNGSALVGAGSTTTGWAPVAWTGRTWAGDAWTGRTWASGTWTGRTWADASWAGRTWAGATWAGRSWAAGPWASTWS